MGAEAIGDDVRLEVGPVEPASAAAWLQWADETCGGLRPQSPAQARLPAEVVQDVRRYLEQWKTRAQSSESTFRWHGEIDPDELEYLVHALFNLDVQTSQQQRGERSVAPEQGRDFHLVLVRAMLHALEMDSPGRAAFVEQLRSAWPTAVEAR